MVKHGKSKKVIRRVGAYLLEHKWLFGMTLALAAGMTLLSVSVPSVIQRVMDKIFNDGLGEGDYLMRGIGLIAVLFLTKEIFNCLRIRVNNKLEQKIIFKLRRDLHDKLLDLPVSFYDKRKSGDIASRVVEDVQNVERAILDGTEQGVTATLTLIGVTAMMFFQEPRLALLVFLPLPVLGIMAYRYSKASKRNWTLVREASGDLNSILVEDIQGNRLIHSFALKDREKARFDKIGRKLEKRSLQAMYRWSIQGPGASFTSSLGILAVVGMGAYLLETDPGFTTGQLFAFLLYANMFYEPVRQLVSINNLVSAGKASGERVFEVLDSEVAIASPEEPVPFPSADHAISFDSVSFSYGERSSIVNDLSFRLPHGSTTALVGPTGSGKSTIANLILRYYDVDRGQVKIGDADIRDLKLEDLRSQIGFVSQDPFLFDASVRENLLLAAPTAAVDELEKSLRVAHAWDFVNLLPEGWDTLIGERGVRLSMGEKQRLTLARAMLKSPPVIILDEATSSVDVETEKGIQRALAKLTRNKTTLIIAHRLSTIRDADRILFLQNGEIIERGNHDELLSLGGAYAKFCKYQQNFVLESASAG